MTKRVLGVAARRGGSPSAPHPRDPGWLLAGLGGVNPVPPIPLPGELESGLALADVTTGGIGARSGVNAARAR